MAHHDTGYKELFSYPELVQQLIEGFAPAEIADIMDLTTLKLSNGNYITPLFEEKLEDLVWSVNINWQGKQQEAYLYLLLEFQSSVDHSMPIRLMHYVACFYDHLLKNKTTTPGKGLPPVFPIVLYNGVQRWSAATDIYDMVTPEPPVFLQPYQPHLRYYLIDEGAYSDTELAEKQSSLSAVFSIEKASNRLDNLQQAVDRVVMHVKNDPNKKRLDRVITRWLKRHLQRLDASVNLQQLNSLVEEQDMLSENLQRMIDNERMHSEQIGMQKGEKQGVEKAARNLITMGMPDEHIIQATGLTREEIQALRQESTH